MLATPQPAKSGHRDAAPAAQRTPDGCADEVRDCVGMPRFIAGAQARPAVGDPLKGEGNRHDEPFGPRAEVATAGHAPPIQAKRAMVSQPGDLLEQEADRVADQIMREPAAEIPRTSHGQASLQRKCAACSSGSDLCPGCAEEEEKEKLIQRQAGSSPEATSPSVPTTVLQDIGPGQPLDDSARAFFEPRLGCDLGDVRVHHDSNAAASAASLNALAYTTGSDIVFASHFYEPDIQAGKRLLAHELTHVVQQTVTAPAVRGPEGTVVQRKPLTEEERLVDLSSDQFRDDERLQAAFDNNPPIRFGERGDAVRKIQQALVDLGFEMPVSTKNGTQEPDGIFGPETYRTVKAFQHMQGITKDGIVGRRTLGELDGRLTGGVAPGTPLPFTVPPGAPVTVRAVDRSPQRFEPCAEGFGLFHWEVAWETNARNGYIVQEMKSAQEGAFCDGTPDSGVAPASDLFWEAWRVQEDGGVHPPPGTDTWQVPVHPVHRGTWQLNGRVFFVEQLDPDAGFKTGNLAAAQAGSLYATAVEPKNLGSPLLTRHAAGRWECCEDVNVHEPLDGSTASPSGTVTEDEVSQIFSDVLSEIPPGGGGPLAESTAVPSPSGSCPPGFTQCDFIDPHISVPGQFALYELYKRGGEQCQNALEILSAVRSLLVQGVYKADEQKPAMMAIRHGTTWWELVPPGEGAIVFEAESPPMVVFRKNLESDRRALGTALNDAWSASNTGQLSIVILSPSLKPCPLMPTPEPEPEPEPEPGRECPPGTIPDPSGELCEIPLPGTPDTECSDKEMDEAFNREKEFCASIKMGLDLACQLGTGPCEIGGTAGKFICDAYERIFGKPAPATKPPECSESNASFYEKCIVGTMIGDQPSMRCFPGTPGQIRDKYRRWPGRVK